MLFSLLEKSIWNVMLPLGHYLSQVALQSIVNKVADVSRHTFSEIFSLIFFYLFCFLLFLIASKAFLIVPWFWHSVLWRFLHYPLQTNLPAMQEDLLATLESKNPSVKEETVRFLTRSFCKSTPASLPKTFLKPTCGSLLKVRGILKIEGGGLEVWQNNLVWWVDSIQIIAFV